MIHWCPDCWDRQTPNPAVTGICKTAPLRYAVCKPVTLSRWLSATLHPGVAEWAAANSRLEEYTRELA